MFSSLTKDLLRWLNPLWVFVIAMFLLLASTLFYPIYGDLITDIRAYEAAHNIQEANYWGLATSLSGARLLMFLFGLFFVVLAALSALARVRNR